MSELAWRMKKVASLLSEARDLVSQGPLDYYLERLAEHSEALTTRFAPIKVSEKAVICHKVECSGGWKGCEKTLAVGSVGTIRSVDYRDGSFVFDWEPDERWFKGSDGKYHKGDIRYTYSLSEKYLARHEEGTLSPTT